MKPTQPAVQSKDYNSVPMEANAQDNQPTQEIQEIDQPVQSQAGGMEIFNSHGDVEPSPPIGPPLATRVSHKPQEFVHFRKTENQVEQVVPSKNQATSEPSEEPAIPVNKKWASLETVSLMIDIPNLLLLENDKMLYEASFDVLKEKYSITAEEFKRVENYRANGL